MSEKPNVTSYQKYRTPRNLSETAWVDALEYRDLIPVGSGDGFLMDPISGKKWRRLNPSQQRLAEFLVGGMARRQAVAEAGFNCTPEAASGYVSSMLATHQPFVNYIISLMTEVRERKFVTLESHLSRLDELGRKAEAEGKYGQAMTAEVHRGKAAGLYTKSAEADEKEKRLDDLEAIDQRLDQLIRRAQEREREVQGKHTFESDEELPASKKSAR